MKLTIAAGRRYAGLASVAAPILVVTLAKMIGFGPLTSQAMLVESDDETLPSAVIPPSEAAVIEPLLQPPGNSAATLARSRDLAGQSATDFASPFYQRPVVEQQPTASESPVEQAPQAPPAFVLSGVMNGRPPVAVIDGNVHRPGDSLGNGWSIESIDARRLTVTLRHTDGRTHVLSAVQP